jgi:hypothetical protein
MVDTPEEGPRHILTDTTNIYAEGPVEVHSWFRDALKATPQERRAVMYDLTRGAGDGLSMAAAALFLMFVLAAGIYGMIAR